MKNFKNLSRAAVVMLSCGILQGGFTYAATQSEVLPKDSNVCDITAAQKEELLSLISKYEDLFAKTEELNDEKLKLMAENLTLKQDQVILKQKLAKSNRREKHYKEKLQQNKANVTPEELQNEIDRVRAQMILEFTNHLGEYVKKNPSKKMKNVDLRGLFSDFITLNVNYTNRGDTTLSPLAIKANAKGTVAGGAALTT